jgi:hypothetical protein
VEKNSWTLKVSWWFPVAEERGNGESVFDGTEFHERR